MVKQASNAHQTIIPFRHKNLTSPVTPWHLIVYTTAIQMKELGPKCRRQKPDFSTKHAEAYRLHEGCSNARNAASLLYETHCNSPCASRFSVFQVYQVAGIVASLLELASTVSREIGVEFKGVVQMLWSSGTSLDTWHMTSLWEKLLDYCYKFRYNNSHFLFKAKKWSIKMKQYIYQISNSQLGVKWNSLNRKYLDFVIVFT